jgi:hypothetical protein
MGMIYKYETSNAHTWDFRYRILLFSQECVTFLGKIKVDEVVRTTQPPLPVFKLDRI